ncbi:MAG TPA: helix-turn-helix domain-containing protein [Draconibacterium sp.]|nr:helix-turn-helix domain-containing protein [Draconibacterium sp.]
MAPKVLKDNCPSCQMLDTGYCKGCFTKDEYSIFKSLTDDELDYLFEGKQQIKYNTGETIIKQNTSSTYVICVKEGFAKVYIEGAAGKKIIIKLIRRLDFVSGGGSVYGNVRKITISAITPVTCCVIDSSKLKKLFSENSQFAVELLRHHTKYSNNLLEKLVNLTQKYMPGRVADTLLYLKNDIYNSKSFTIPLTRQDLADMSNMTKESFVRILQEFKISELIKVQRNTFTIIDEEGLTAISKNG